MSKKTFCFLCCLLLIFPCCAAGSGQTASADGNQVTEWKLTGWECSPRSISTLCLSRFCRDLPVTRHNKSALFSDEPNRIWIVWIYGDDPVYRYDNDLNIIPEESGFDAPHAEEIIMAATEVLEPLGLNKEHWKAKPLFFASCGRFSGCKTSRKVVFEETLDDLPLRWSETSLSGSRNLSGFSARRYDIEVVFSDENILLSVEGNWCAFEPLASADSLISEEEVTAVFRAAGKAVSVPEKCWFLHPEGSEVIATLAWRVGNGYVNAADGSWLQTGL